MEAELLFVLCMAKLGRKISQVNATIHPDIKSLIGIRILFKQTDVRHPYTHTFILIENVIYNE